ncbi:altered inheritance of mitochondria protein 44-like [Papaver somniferum]|uniref:altered inheritance of mitochondria protein 44-like n=1 Tax=Papaver somniferum TaxID=3469 RepID=UPI000E701747|nr:altered inheritance of mitochondria protein 44-like [Papaver somniferum]
MILTEGRFKSSCSQLELSQQNASLENEVNRLKMELQEVQKLRGELQVANLEVESLRNRNQELRVQHETLLKELKTQNEKIIQSKINLTVKKNHLQEQYNQLKRSHDVLKKKNKSLSADEKKIRSRINGSVGDDFDKVMESMKNNTLILSKFCEDSEKSNQSTVTQLRYDLSKVRKERLNLELSLAASRDRARRRLAHQQSFLEINVRNLEKGVIRKAHASAQSVVNGILLSNSLPAVRIHPINVGEDEEYPEPDSDYEFVNDDEKDKEDEEDQIEKEKSVDKTNAEIENPGSNIDAQKSLVEQDVAAKHVYFYFHPVFPFSVLIHFELVCYKEDNIVLFQFQYFPLIRFLV